MKAKTKLKTLYFARIIIKLGFWGVQLALVFLIFSAAFSVGISARNKYHTPVTDAEIGGVISGTPENVYPVSDLSVKLTKADADHKVKVGDYTLTVSDDTYQTYLADTDSIQTELSVLEIHCDDILSEPITFVRVLAFGEEPFTEENIAPYIEYAKAYYTEQRYKWLFFDDAAAYKVKAPKELVKRQGEISR